MSPARNLAVVLPARDKKGFKMTEREKIPEEKLIPEDSLTADYKGQGEGDRVVELKCVKPDNILFIVLGYLRRRSLILLNGRVGVILIKSRHAHNPHQPLGQPDFIHLNLDVFLEWILG